ncbi:hypothetical protein GHT09_000816 [Marmota monax]|uniref:STAS domain-containing protein n=1 Tax=Marmota monax TaxID=9995 RepID=A0A834PYH5_MARMO|nr:hypothetical protein GHT09_000816 [Marmota monax]
MEEQADVGKCLRALLSPQGLPPEQSEPRFQGLSGGVLDSLPGLGETRLAGPASGRGSGSGLSSGTVSLQELQQDFENASPTDPNNNQTPANGASISYITFSPDTSSATPCEPSASAGSPSEPSDTLASVPPFVTFHTLILDMSGVSFVDLMGIKALGKVRPPGRGCMAPTPAPRTPLTWSPHFNQLKDTQGP